MKLYIIEEGDEAARNRNIDQTLVFVPDEIDEDALLQDEDVAFDYEQPRVVACIPDIPESNAISTYRTYTG